MSGGRSLTIAAGSGTSRGPHAAQERCRAAAQVDHQTEEDANDRPNGCA